MTMQVIYEQVYTITSYDDGPRSGIADYDGMPHLYTSIWTDDFEEYEPCFALTPVSAEAFDLAREDWRIWSRWEAAFYDGRASYDTHPALPEDRERQQQLQGLLASILVVNPETSFCAQADFRRSQSVFWNGKGLGPFEAAWSRTGNAIPMDRLVSSRRRVLDS